MSKFYVLAITLLFCSTVFAQGILQGKVIDENNQPLNGANILLPDGRGQTTDINGHYMFSSLNPGTFDIQASFIGYDTKTTSVTIVKDQTTTVDIVLVPGSVQLVDVVVTADNAHDQHIVSNVDIALRPINNSQEILRMVPGLFIAQHAGGGKAEQIFLRGMDLDHGTDIRITVDGLPVNMVSHAHGQGYADLHFVIPELVQNVDFNKGTYHADNGNLNTAGSVDFNMRKSLDQNFVKAEGGQFNSYRTVAGFNLLGKESKRNGQSAYLAGEYNYSRSFFDLPQHFKRLNLFGKYTGKISNNSTVTASASTLWSKWDFAGEIPNRAWQTGAIGFFGALDSTQNGFTSRTNVNIQMLTNTSSGDIIKNQVYYTNNQFELYSNFTYFLEDPVKGDQIRQKESRNMFGYNGSYSHQGMIANKIVTTTAGINYRHDVTYHTELSHTLNGSTTLNPLELGNIDEQNAGIYLDELIEFSSSFTMNAGIRIDWFRNQYENLLTSSQDKAHITSSIVSPKLNFYYTLSPSLQFYSTSGKGFHSNDTRAVVSEKGLKTLPAAYSSDLGAIFKPVPNLIVNIAGWYMWMDQEFVYSGDEGVVEPTGKTKRAGIDLTVRYQITRKLFFDADLNTANPRYIGAPAGESRVPLGPILTTTGGLSYKNTKGFGGSFRYRYMADRPVTEDYSIVANGYFICDALVNYSSLKYQFGLSIQNIFNRRWEEAQFATTTRLKNEATPVTEICYTPGTPFFTKLSITRYF